MRPLLRLLSPLWQVQRRRRPDAARRVDAAVLALRTRADLLGEVQALRARLAELERDHLLLAAAVAALTERLAAGPVAETDEDDEAKRARARLAAIAFYEERIGRLEDRIDGRRGRRDRGAASAGRTSDEPEERV